MKVSSKTIFSSLAIVPDSAFKEERRMLRWVCEKMMNEEMDELNERDKHLLVVRGWFGMSFNEISLREHISVEVARMRYGRLVKKLKVMMMRHFVSVNHICKEQSVWELS